MADMGDKVGDVYVDVHAELDRKGLRKTEAQLNKDAERIQQNLNKRFSTSFQRNLDQTLKRAAQSEFAAQNATMQKLQRQRTDALKTREKDEQASLRRRMSRVRTFEESIRLAQIQALKEDKVRFDARQKMLEKNSRGGRRRGKDGGRLGVAEGFENVLSILPGQIEKLFRNPYIAAAAVGAGVALADALILGFAGTLSAGLAAVGIGGMIAVLVKKDQDVANAFSNIGTRAMSALLDQAAKFKPEVLSLFSSMASDIDGFLRGINMKGLIDTLPALRKGFSGFLTNAQPGIQMLLDLGGKVLQDFAHKTLPEIGSALTSMADAFKDNEVEIRFMMKAIGGFISGTIKFIGALVRIASVGLDAVMVGFEKVSSALLSMMLVYNAAAGKIPGIGEDLKIPQSTIDSVLAFNTNAKFLGQNSLPQLEHGAEGAAGGLNLIKDTTLEAIPPARTLAEQMQAQADAFQAAFDKQQQLDGALRTGMETEVTYQALVDDATAALKTNGKTLDLNKEKGRANFALVQQGFKDLKASYLTDVQEGRISADKAREQFSRRAQGVLANFDKGSPAYRAMQAFLAQLDDFPTEKVVDLQVSGYAVAKANIDKLKADLRGLSGAGAQAKAKAQQEKNKATGGAIRGPGTGTSDSIPANLSNGEFVIKASSAKKIGMGNLAAMNSSGKMPQAFATGGSAGNGRGSSAREKSTYEALLRQISSLTKTIGTQTKSLAVYNEQMKASKDQFSSFVNLGSLKTEGATTGGLMQELQGRKAKAGGFAKNLAALRKKGLSTGALQQVTEAGPDSPLAKMLLSASAFDINMINGLLGGASGYGASIGNTMSPGGTAKAKSMAANKALLTKKKAQAKKLKPVRAKGATVSHAGGKISALFSKKEMQSQKLQAGTYVTVMIDGKEVRALVKQEQSKTTAKNNRSIKSGRK